MAEDTLILANIKHWLQREFPEMVWEEDDATFGRYLVSRRAGFEDKDGHFYVGVSKTHCWVSGHPGWVAVSRKTPFDPDSSSFVEMVQDIKSLKSRYTNEVRLCGSYKKQKATPKSGQAETAGCVIQ